MEPNLHYSPEEWEKKTPEEQQDILIKGPSFALLSIFIYDQHPSLPEYPIKIRGEEIFIRYHMIDFRHMYNFKSPRIISPDNSPIEAKILQIKIKTREELRNKIAHFFGRPAEEDLI